jgi:hypothetical protein
LEAFKAVLGAAFKQGVKAGEFVIGGGDDDFSADLMRDGVFAAEVDHLADAGDGETGFL